MNYVPYVANRLSGLLIRNRVEIRVVVVEELDIRQLQAGDMSGQESIGNSNFKIAHEGVINSIVNRQRLSGMPFCREIVSPYLFSSF